MQWCKSWFWPGYKSRPVRCFRRWIRLHYRYISKIKRCILWCISSYVSETTVSSRQTKSIFVKVKIIACKGLYSKYGSISYRLDAMGDFRLFVPFKLILHIKHRSISHRLGTNYAFHFRAFMHKYYLNVPWIKLDTYFSSPQLRKTDD